MACRKTLPVGLSEAGARSLAHHVKCFACKAAIFHRQDGRPTQRPLSDWLGACQASRSLKFASDTGLSKATADRVSERLPAAPGPPRDWSHGDQRLGRPIAGFEPSPSSAGRKTVERLRRYAQGGSP